MSDEYSRSGRRAMRRRQDAARLVQAQRLPAAAAACRDFPDSESLRHADSVRLAHWDRVKRLFQGHRKARRIRASSNETRPRPVDHDPDPEFLRLSARKKKLPSVTTVAPGSTPLTIG